MFLCSLAKKNVLMLRKVYTSHERLGELNHQAENAMSTTNTVQPNEWNLLPENHSSKSVKPNLADNHGMNSF